LNPLFSLVNDNEKKVQTTKEKLTMKDDAMQLQASSAIIPRAAFILSQ